MRIWIARFVESFGFQPRLSSSILSLFYDRIDGLSRSPRRQVLTGKIMQYSRNLHKQPLQSVVERGIICPASLVRTVFLQMRTINSLWNDGSCCVRAVQFREAVSTEVCTKPPIIRGALAQLVARNVRIVEVRGSNPLCSTKKGTRINTRVFCFGIPRSWQNLTMC